MDNVYVSFSLPSILHLFISLFRFLFLPTSFVQFFLSVSRLFILCFLSSYPFASFSCFFYFLFRSLSLLLYGAELRPLSTSGLFIAETHP